MNDHETLSAQVHELKNDPGLAFLTVSENEDTTSGKLAAVNIRLELRRRFPNTKFRVHRPKNGIVNIAWLDGPTVHELEDDVSRKYETGRFDGVLDIASTNVQAFNIAFGGSRYIFSQRSHSDELIKQALCSLFQRYATSFQGIALPTADDYNSGALFRVHVPALSTTLQQLLATELAKTKIS